MVYVLKEAGHHIIELTIGRKAIMQAQAVRTVHDPVG